MTGVVLYPEVKRQREACSIKGKEELRSDTNLLSLPAGESQVPAPAREGGDSAAGGSVHRDHHRVPTGGSAGRAAPPLSAAKGPVEKEGPHPAPSSGQLQLRLGRNVLHDPASVP